MKIIYKHLNIFFISLTLLIFLPFIHANAASIGFSPSSGSYNVGDTLNLNIYTNTNSKSINGASVNIKFPSNILYLSSISKKQSVINLWSKEPFISNKEGTVSFEGVILDGYIGDNAVLATLSFKVKASGIANINFGTASILANDGNGTDILSSKGSSSFKIDIKKDSSKIDNSIVGKNIDISEIKNNSSKYSTNKFLITSIYPIVGNSYSVQIDSMDKITWIDDGTHIFQIPTLKSGSHAMKVFALNKNSDILSGYLKFDIINLKTPLITNYPNIFYTGQSIVLKGVADPLVDVELTINNSSKNIPVIEHAYTNSDGKFTYVPDDEDDMLLGNYSIVARALTVDGISSDYMEPIQITKKGSSFSLFISRGINYVTLLIPFISLVFLLAIIILYIYSYSNKKLRKFLDKKEFDKSEKCKCE